MMGRPLESLTKFPAPSRETQPKTVSPASFSNFSATSLETLANLWSLGLTPARPTTFEEIT